MIRLGTETAFRESESVGGDMISLKRLKTNKTGKARDKAEPPLMVSCDLHICGHSSLLHESLPSLHLIPHRTRFEFRFDFCQFIF